MTETWRNRIKPLASLRLTVILMALSMWLIFAGTWAQIDMGIWSTLKTYFRTWYVFIPFQVFLPRDWSQADGLRGMLASLGMPFPGGYVLGGLLMINLLAAHAVRFKLNRRRIGVILIHVGIVLLLIGELVTAVAAREANMTIAEGQTVSYTEDIREPELAIIERTEGGDDRVIAVPRAVLKRSAKNQQPVFDDALPFQFVVEDYMPNSQPLGPFQAQGKKPRATAGLGARHKIVIEQAKPVSGVEGGAVDVPAALITIYHNGKPLGTWLTSIWLEHLVEQGSLSGPHLQPVQIGDKTYHIALRFKREYRDYALRLHDFRHDKYLGTETPRNFSSQVQLIDPANGVDREVKIYMNHPLRYRGETFYQAAFKPGNTTTILQVVRNPGWLLPYIACTVGAIGMCIHFGLALTMFLGNRKKRIAAVEDKTAAAKTSGGWLAVAICLVMVVYVAGKLRPPSSPDGYNIPGYAAVPVVDRGRVKPIDTLARVNLMLMSNKQEVTLEDGDKLPASRWLLDVMAHDKAAREMKVIRIDHPDIKDTLGLDADEKLFSFNEVMSKRDELAKQIGHARTIDAKQRTSFQRQVMKLSESVGLFNQMEMLGDTSVFLLPPKEQGGKWRTFADAGHDLQHHDKIDPAADAWIALWRAWINGEPAAFNASVNSLHQHAAAGLPASRISKVKLEAYLNHASPFILAAAVYVVIFVLAGLSWLGDSPWLQQLRRAAMWLLIGTLVMHTLGLAARIYIQGRPPVTNLYSSAVFVGWGAAVLGAFLERVFRNGVGVAVAAAVGFMSLLVAHHLSFDGDTMTMMQAVLDTNFWLATHVVVITLGYSATFLAGFLAILYILRGVLTRAQTTDEARSLARMIYGVICFATLFSFVGTILGGIWADQSWGRFWGWDPKENGALLIVLWNALVLHARWGGIVQQRGIAVLAVAGNIVTAWSWFGTNMLGVGLHSYGFMDSAVFWLSMFVFSQLLIMAVGLLPLPKWRSAANVSPVPA